MTGGDVLIALAVGLIAGAAAGLLGLGGGFLMVPAMVVLLGEPQHVAQGTSLLVIVPTTLVGTVANVKRGNLGGRFLVPLGVAGVLGAAAGALASTAIDEVVLQRVFGAVLIVISVRLLFQRSAEGDA